MDEPGDENGDADGQAAEHDRPTDGEFESERTATRAEAAAALRGLADGVDTGAVSIGAGEDAVTAAVPEEFEFEVEYERDGDECEIEVELEWATDDEPSLRAVAEGDSAGDTDGDDRPAVETATVAASGGATAEPGGVAGEADEVVDESDADADEAARGSDADTDEADAGAGEADADADRETAGSEASAAERAAASTAAAAPTAPVEAVAPLASQARFEVFRDRASEWRWRLVHRNGNVIASSGEGYTRRHNAEKGMRSVMENAPGADVVEDD